VRHLKYAGYLLRHKWYVFVEACRLGIPWRGLTHDLSKFRPDEWGPYAEYFYGGWHRPWASVSNYGKQNHYNLERRLSQEGVQEAFDAAWLKHQHANDHHWQHWVLREDSGAVKRLPMSQAARREMLADWRGAGRAITGKDNTAEWWLQNRDKMLLHDETRAWVEQQLGSTQPNSHSDA